MSEMEAILQQMQELTNTVKEHREDRATLDMDAIKAAFKDLMDEYQEAQPKPVPVRRGEQYEDVPASTQRGKGGIAVKDGVVQEGKFEGCDAMDLWIVRESLRIGGKPISGELRKAMDSTTDGSGDDFVPTLMGSKIWPQVYLQSKIVQALGPMIPMPSNPYHIPIWSTYTWYVGTENTAVQAASNPTTAQSILTATELLAEVDWSYTLDEDSIVPMLPNLRAELVRGAAEEMDFFVLNADSTDANNINEHDNADGDAYDHWRTAGQDGIRHYYMVDDTGQAVNAGGDALTDTDVVNALSGMGKYAVNPQDCFMVADAGSYLNGLLNLDTVITVDKFGPGATVLTGQLAAYRGIPIIVSESMKLTMADGMVDSTSNTLGQIAIVNKRMWKVGSWRGLLVEMDKDIQKRQTIMVASFRLGVAAYDRTSDHSAGIYNILV